ncbi:MAG: polyketide cyclase [Flavobacterium sp.]|nr:MAG: polyketide cyclase [Flavobacterium sp.]
MMIRKPVAEVFNAFIDPAITTKFWFTSSSGKLEEDKSVTWEWKMYNASAVVHVLRIIQNEKIVFKWNSPARMVEFTFTSIGDDKTYVVAKESGYSETGNDLIRIIKDSTGGFTTVLDGLKAYLEHNISLNLIGDKFPPELTKH